MLASPTFTSPDPPVGDGPTEEVIAEVKRLVRREGEAAWRLGDYLVATAPRTGSRRQWLMALAGKAGVSVSTLNHRWSASSAFPADVRVSHMAWSVHVRLSYGADPIANLTSFLGWCAEHDNRRPTWAAFTAWKGQASMELIHLSVADLRASVGEGVRRDPVGIKALAASMDAIGLVHPLLVRPDPESDCGYALTAGRCRLEAAHSLGWETIACTVVEHDDAAAAQAEWDENQVRTDPSPMDKNRLYRRRLAIETEEAAKRRAAELAQNRESDRSADSAERSAGGDARDIAAVGTGLSHDSHKKIGVILAAAKDETLAEEVRLIAQEAARSLETPGASVNAAAQAVAEAKARAEAAAARAARAAADPDADWTDEEKSIRAQMQADPGLTIVVNIKTMPRLVEWAEAAGRYVKIDRRTDWGNPFVLPDDGDRATVIANYGQHYFPHKPSLQSRLHTLRGKALGCWCAPEPCHGDGLAAKASLTRKANS